MDKAIVTALLIIVGMIMALMLFNAAFPAIVGGGDAIANMANRADERLRSQVAIIHVSGELNADGWWQDTNANGIFDVFIWVKNIGATRIVGLERLDVFFGPEGNFTRIPHQTQAGGSSPYWTYTVENGTEWTPTSTLRITVHFPATLASGRYFSKVIAPNGVSDEYFLGL